MELNQIIIINQENNYFVIEQKVFISIKERLKELFKAFLSTTAAIITLGLWTKATKLSERSWKRFQVDYRLFRARIDQSFFKTHHFIRGKLFHATQLSKLIAHHPIFNFKPVLIPKPIEEKPRIKKQIQDLPAEILRKIITNDFDRKDKLSAISVSKNWQKQINKAALEEVSHINRYVEKLIATIDPIAYQAQIKAILAYLNDRGFLNPILTENERLKMFQKKIGTIFYEFFEDQLEVLCVEGVNYLVATHQIRQKFADLGSNVELFRAIIQYDGNLLKWASDEIQNNFEIVKTAINTDAEAIHYASPELKDDREIIKSAVIKNPEMIKHVSPALCRDPEIAKLAVAKQGWLLRYTPNFQDNFEVVEAAVANNGSAIRFVSDELKNNKKIIEAAVKNSGLCLQWASREMRADPEIVKVAVLQEGIALEYASIDLRNDLEIVKSAVTHRGCALQHASDAMRNNLEVVIAAVTENDFAIRYASEELQKHPDVIKAARNGAL